VFRVGVPGKPDSKVLLLFETKYHTQNSLFSQTPSIITRKAVQALAAVRSYVVPCGICRVCFVYCNSAVRLEEPSSLTAQGNPFDLTEKVAVDGENKATSLHEVMDNLAAQGCTTSLHTVWTEAEWRSLLGCLYLVVPDIGEPSVAVGAAKGTTSAGVQ
jgi:hypothetical protein